jgi:hypothetical protein
MLKAHIAEETMGVRLEKRGPFAVYRFERGSTQRITLELPAVIKPPPLPPKRSPMEPPPLPGARLIEPI